MNLRRDRRIYWLAPTSRRRRALIVHAVWVIKVDFAAT